MKTMKNFAMFAAAAMMLTTSCSNDETFEQLGNEAQVKLSLGLENAMNTRAISDGEGIDQLTYAIFDKTGNRVAGNKLAERFPWDINVTLLKGETYTAVFWAQDQDCEAYTISEDYTTVSVNYKGLNNDETRDAFFRSETFTVTGDANLDIVLKRPFAQMNVGVSTEEWDNAVRLGYTVVNSSAEIKQAATKMNLVDGTVSEFDDITFATSAIPTEDLLVDVDCDGTSETYKYLSMSYFLAADEMDGASKTTLEDLKFTLASEDGKTAVLEEGLENVPVQRNHRTNIISFGEGLLTGKYSVKVVLDPLYDGEHTLTNENVWEENLGIYTEEALAGQEIKIPAGWHIRNGYILEPMPENWDNNKIIAPDDTHVIYENSYIINGQGNTVTFEPYEYTYVAKNAFAAYGEGVEVTVKNIAFAGEHLGVFAGVHHDSKRDNFVTHFENVSIVNNGNYYYNINGAIPLTSFAASGTTTLDNCTITGSYWVGKEKDGNSLAEAKFNEFNGIYDVFVANSNKKYTTINNSIIGRIYVQNHGNLIVEGSSVVDEIAAMPLVSGTITIKSGVKVESMNITQYSSGNPIKITIESGAEVGQLNLKYSDGHTLKTNKISIQEGATVGKITANGEVIEL